MESIHRSPTSTISKFTGRIGTDAERYEERDAAAKPDSGLDNLSKKPWPAAFVACIRQQFVDAGLSSVFVMRHAQSPSLHIETPPLIMHE